MEYWLKHRIKFYRGLPQSKQINFGAIPLEYSNIELQLTGNGLTVFNAVHSKILTILLASESNVLTVLFAVNITSATFDVMVRNFQHPQWCKIISYPWYLKLMLMEPLHSPNEDLIMVLTVPHLYSGDELVILDRNHVY